MISSPSARPLRSCFCAAVCLLLPVLPASRASDRVPQRAALLRSDAAPLPDAALQSLRFAPRQGESAGAAAFRSGEQRVEVPLERLVRWGNPAAARGPLLLLADGGRVPVTEALAPLRVADEVLHADSPLFGELQLPLELLSAVVLRVPADTAARDALLDRLTAAADRPPADRLLLTGGDELRGTLQDWEAGVLQFVVGGEALSVQVEQVEAIAFNPALIRRPPAARPRLALGFRDGGLLTAESVAGGNDRPRGALFGGLALPLPLDQLVYLQPLGLEIDYLSDLEPTGYRHVPFLDLQWDYRHDRNVLGGRMRAGGHKHLKGLGMHSPSRITYRLQRPYRRFQAELALDDTAGNRGSVQFRVLIDDGSGQWKPVYTSPVVRGGQPPRAIDLEIQGARQISLLVDYADRGDQLDHANWLDARLVP